MTVGELIMRLQGFDPTLEIVVVDNWVGSVYAGAYSLKTKDFNDKQVLTIDVGGYQLEEER
jgi:hypothetical protein